jgi:hypothetical protein
MKGYLGPISSATALQPPSAFGPCRCRRQSATHSTTSPTTASVCFDNVVAYAWKVTSESPPTGTMVQRNQKISLTGLYDPSAPE